MNLLTQEHTLGTHGLADEHIWVCKWCMADVRLYLQLKPICKWLREKVEDKMVELIIQFCGHQLSVGQTLMTHRHSRWRSWKTGDDLPSNIVDVDPLLQFAITYNVETLLEACVRHLQTTADLSTALMLMRSRKRLHPEASEAHKRLRREWIRRFDAADELERTLLLDATGTI